MAAVEEEVATSGEVKEVVAVIVGMPVVLLVVAVADMIIDALPMAVAEAIVAAEVVVISGKETTDLTDFRTDRVTDLTVSTTTISQVIEEGLHRAEIAIASAAAAAAAAAVSLLINSSHINSSSSSSSSSSSNSSILAIVNLSLAWRVDWKADLRGAAALSMVLLLLLAALVPVVPPEAALGRSIITAAAVVVRVGSACDEAGVRAKKPPIVPGSVPEQELVLGLWIGLRRDL
jgi:hypothetical protein